MTDNTHKVAQKQWRKWSDQQRAMFNEVYESIQAMGASIFLHPDTVERKLTDKEFDVIAWNAAWESVNAAHHVSVTNVTVNIAAQAGAHSERAKERLRSEAMTGYVDRGQVTRAIRRTA